MNSSKSKLLNESKLGNSASFSDLDIEKIRELIKLLEDHQLKCEKSGKFVEAELTKQRVAQLMKMEEEKCLQEAKEKQIERKQQLEAEQLEEFKAFNLLYDEKFQKMTAKFEQLDIELKEHQEKESNELVNNFNQEYPEVPKPSAELVNLNKLLEMHVKQKDYPNAHVVQVKIAELTNNEKEKFLEEKEKKLSKEIDKMKAKHETEGNALQMRYQANYGALKRERALQLETLLLKYKNKLKDLDEAHKYEISNFSKILKGTAKPNAKMNTFLLTQSKMGVNVQALTAGGNQGEIKSK